MYVILCYTAKTNKQKCIIQESIQTGDGVIVPRSHTTVEQRLKCKKLATVSVTNKLVAINQCIGPKFVLCVLYVHVASCTRVWPFTLRTYCSY